MRRPGILDLRPTQFVLGMKEIESKITKMSAFTKKQLQAYCDDHVIPIVIGPRGEPYLIDHHHFARACWELDVDLFTVKVLKDYRHKSEKGFWNLMIRKDWVYLYDQFGVGPHSPYALPADIRGLADDPFRSLVWAVLDAGAIEKQDLPFFEFKWAMFFRFNLHLPLHAKSDFRDAIAAAKKLATSKAARKLPGYLA